MPKQKLAYWGGIIIASLVIGVSLQFVRAWVEPTSPPPTDNIGAPITTGNASQNKSGGFTDYSWLQSPGMYAQRFYDDIERTYFLDPNSYSRLNTIFYNGSLQGPVAAISDVSAPSLHTADVFSTRKDTGNPLDPFVQFDTNIYLSKNGPAQGNILADGYVNSTIYYDRNNGNYYMDPNNSSKLNNLYVTGAMNYTYGGAGAGKVLTSDANGWAYWADPPSAPTPTSCPCGNCWQAVMSGLCMQQCTPSGWVTVDVPGCGNPTN